MNYENKVKFNPAICFTVKNKEKHFTLTIFVWKDELSCVLEEHKNISKKLFIEVLHKDEFEKIETVKNAIKIMNVENALYSASINDSELSAYFRLSDFFNFEFSVIATLDRLINKIKKSEVIKSE